MFAGGDCGGGRFIIVAVCDWLFCLCVRYDWRVDFVRGAKEDLGRGLNLAPDD